MSRRKRKEIEIAPNNQVEDDQPLVSRPRIDRGIRRQVVVEKKCNEDMDVDKVYESDGSTRQEDDGDVEEDDDDFVDYPDEKHNQTHLTDIEGKSIVEDYLKLGLLSAQSLEKQFKLTPRKLKTYLEGKCNKPGRETRWQQLVTFCGKEIKRLQTRKNRIL